MKTVTVFGSGTVQPSSTSWALAFETGKLLGAAGVAVINGGYAGVMEASAKGARECGGKTIGVTTDEFPGISKNKFITEEIRLPTWRERLHRLIELGDGFIVCDGGTGTMTELMVVLEMHKNGLHQKPVAVLGTQMNQLLNAMGQNPEVKYPENLFRTDEPRQAVNFLLKELES